VIKEILIYRLSKEKDIRYSTSSCDILLLHVRSLHLWTHVMTSSLHATKWCRASSCFLLISEIRVSRNKAHAAPRVSFYGLFVVETKLITPRGSAPYRRVRIIHPLCAREGAAFFIKSHISRARRRPINLPWRFLLWRRAKPWERKREGGGEEEEKERMKKRETRTIHISCRRRRISARRNPFYFHIRPASDGCYTRST